MTNSEQEINRMISEGYLIRLPDNNGRDRIRMTEKGYELLRKRGLDITIMEIETLEEEQA